MGPSWGFCILVTHLWMVLTSLWVDFPQEALSNTVTSWEQSNIFSRSRDCGAHIKLIRSYTPIDLTSRENPSWTVKYCTFPKEQFSNKGQKSSKQERITKRKKNPWCSIKRCKWDLIYNITPGFPSGTQIPACPIPACWGPPLCYRLCPPPLL